jgi:AcrR family transcriptional regulator
MSRNKETSQEMRTQSRAALLSAARRLFAEQGYFNCTVSDIARQAGMSQGNVYWYFDSKETLLKAVLADGFETLGAMLEAAAARPGAGAEKLDFLLAEYFTFAREGGDFSTILLSLFGHGGDAFMQSLGFDMRVIGAGYHQKLSVILAQGQAEGTVAPDMDPNLLSMFFFALFNGLMITYGKEWVELPKEIIRQAFLRLLGSKAQM